MLNRTMLMIAACVVGVLVAAEVAGAGVLYYEGFDYTADTDLCDAAAWTQTGGDKTGDDYDLQAMVVAGSLSYGDLQTSGNMIRNEEVNENWGQVATSTGLTNPATGERWLSFLFSSNLNNNFQYDYLSVGEYNILTHCMGSSDNSTTAGSAAFSMGGWTNNGGSAYNHLNGVARSDTGVHMFVAKFDYTPGSESISFYIDPDLDDDAGDLVAFATVDATGLTDKDKAMSMAGIAIRYCNNLNASKVDWWMDEIRIGDTWADVSVPEPATLCVLSTGALGLLARRRRR